MQGGPQAGLPTVSKTRRLPSGSCDVRNLSRRYTKSWARLNDLQADPSPPMSVLQRLHALFGLPVTNECEPPIRWLGQCPPPAPLLAPQFLQYSMVNVTFSIVNVTFRWHKA